MMIYADGEVRSSVELVNLAGGQAYRLDICGIDLYPEMYAPGL